MQDIQQVLLTMANESVRFRNALLKQTSKTVEPDVSFTLGVMHSVVSELIQHIAVLEDKVKQLEAK